MGRPVSGSTHTFTLPLFSQSTGQWLASPTLAVGDVKVSTDGGALANITTLPTVNPAGSGIVEVTLSVAEVGTNYWCVQFVDAAGDEWKSTHYNDTNDAASAGVKNITTETTNIQSGG